MLLGGGRAVGNFFGCYAGSVVCMCPGDGSGGLRRALGGQGGGRFRGSILARPSIGVCGLDYEVPDGALFTRSPFSNSPMDLLRLVAFALREAIRSRQTARPPAHGWTAYCGPS